MPYGRASPRSGAPHAFIKDEWQHSSLVLTCGDSAMSRVYAPPMRHEIQRVRGRLPAQPRLSGIQIEAGMLIPVTPEARWHLMLSMVS